MLPAAHIPWLLCQIQPGILACASNGTGHHSDNKDYRTRYDREGSAKIVSSLSLECDSTLGEMQKALAVPQHLFLTQALWKQVTGIQSCMSTSGKYSCSQCWEVLATPPAAPSHCLVCSCVFSFVNSVTKDLNQ